MKRYSEEEKQFIYDNYKGIKCDELVKRFNERFNDKLTKQQMAYFKKHHKLRSGVKTTFKKGCTPHNKKEIGYEFFDKTTGYTYIKVKDNKWVQKQRYIWEQYNGKIPKGYSVVFTNQDKTDFRIENLMLVSDRDKLVAKNKKLFTTDSELTKSGLLVAKLINKIKDKHTPSN